MKKILLFSLLALALEARLAPASGTTATNASTGTREVSITSKVPAAVEHFKTARGLLSNVRQAEGEAELKKALAADPDFALAHAFLAQVATGSESLKEIERAETLAAGLPENEHMLIEALAAGIRGDAAKEKSLFAKLAVAAPGDYYVHLTRGQLLSAERNWSEAEAALAKATELNPGAGPAFNALGYARLAQEKNEAAIEAFKKYVALSPTEPNPNDSLGDALLAAGRLDEAEAAYKKALETSPSFAISWQGVAQARFLRGDVKGATEALAKYKAAAPRAEERLDAGLSLAWCQLADGKSADHDKTLDEVEKEAQAAKLDRAYAFVPIVRGMALVEAGKFDEALAQAKTGRERGTKATLPGRAHNAIERNALAVQTTAEARLGKLDDAKKSLAALEEETKKVSTSAEAQSLLDQTRGEVALASGDAKGAVASFARCIPQDSYCRWRLVQAQDKAGDPAASEATRKKLLAANLRDADYLYVRAQAQAAKVAGPKDSGAKAK